MKTKDLGIMLAREELEYLLLLVKSGPILGLDPDPIAKDLSKEELTRRYAQAERSLRARDLASINSEGDVVIREAITLMVGTCAYPEFLITAHSFPSDGTPKRIYFNGRTGSIISHERPEAPLHRLSFIENRSVLLEDILSLCSIEDLSKFDCEKISTTNEILKNTREESEKYVAKAIKKLTETGVSKNAAKELCVLLGDSHKVTMLHSLVASTEGEPEKETITILAGKTSTWRMDTIDEDKDTVVLYPVSKEDLLTLFTSWTKPADNWLEVPTLTPEE